MSDEDEVADGDEGPEAAAVGAPTEEAAEEATEEEAILAMGELEETEPPLEPHPRPPRSRLSRFRLQEQLDVLEKSMEPEFAALWPNRGLRTSFPLLCDSLDGYRNYLYVIAGGSRMGKSTMLLQTAYDLVRMHEDARVLYLSLDQPVRDTQLRLVGMAGQVNIDYLVDPDPDKDKKYERKKRKGLQAIRRLRNRLFVVDESEGAIDLDEVRAMVDELRTERSDGPLFVFIDPIYKIRVDGLQAGTTLDELTGFLSRELKTMCMEQRCGVVVSTRLDRGAGAERPLLTDLEEQSVLLYEAAAVMLLYFDAANDGSTPFLEWEWGTDDMMVPIFELDVAKNKMGPAAGRLFYRFYQSFARFKECSDLEVDNFRRMLQNLRRHSGEEISKEPEVPKIEDVSATLPAPPPASTEDS